MNIKVISILFCLLLLKSVQAQTISNRDRVKKLYAAIDKNFTDKKSGLYYEVDDSTKKHSYLWPLCALIQAANEIEVLTPSKSYMPAVADAIEQYKNVTPPSPAYQAVTAKEKVDTRYYDDNQWVAIAYMDAYDRTHKKQYLERSEMICKFMLTGLDTVAGGGFYWREKDYSSKNTCSNGPGILVLLQLYLVMHQQTYLSTAIDVYRWTNKYLQAPEGVYYDNIQTKDLKVGKAEFTYNTGTMLQANVLLYQVTRDAKYLTEAKRVATAAREHFFKNGRLPNGNYWFNAVMLRGYQELYKVDKNKAWIDFFQQDADAIWDTERDNNDMVGTKPVKSLIDQAAMIEIYARLEEIGKL